IQRLRAENEQLRSDDALLKSSPPFDRQAIKGLALKSHQEGAYLQQIGRYKTTALLGIAEYISDFLIRNRFIRHWVTYHR
ncbi:hypothetical protein HYE53_10595, partial [Aggregatibacter actinomycetemcomitans]|nr:hypothetical protein [Aggregatibacter actinomycetemcomitans]